MDEDVLPYQHGNGHHCAVVYLYDTVFGGKGVVERDAGAGAAVGVVLTLIIIAVYVITNLILKDSDLEY